MCACVKYNKRHLKKLNCPNCKTLTKETSSIYYSEVKFYAVRQLIKHVTKKPLRCGETSQQVDSAKLTRFVVMRIIASLRSCLLLVEFW